MKNDYSKTMQFIDRLFGQVDYEKVYDSYREIIKSGNSFYTRGNLEEALKYYEKAVELWKPHAEIDLNFKHIWSSSLNNLGNVLRDMGRHEEAKVQYEQAVDIYEALLESNPNNVEVHVNMATTQNEFAILLRNMSRFEEARTRYKKAADIYEALLESYPDNTVYRAKMATTLSSLGWLLSAAMGRHEEAKARYEQAVDMRVALLESDPHNDQYKQNVATSWNNLGNVLRDMGRLEETKVRYEQALEMYEALLEPDPHNDQYQSNVAGTLNNLGVLLSNMGRLEEAKARSEQALEMYEALLESDSHNNQHKENVATSRNTFGNVLSDMGRLEEAKAWREQALEMYETLLKSDPDSTIYKTFVAMARSNLGNLLSEMGRLEEAKARYENALDVCKVLHESDLNNAEYKANLATVMGNLSSLLSDMGRLEEAKAQSEQALEMYEALLKSDSHNDRYQECVAMAQSNLGKRLRNMGRHEEAKVQYEQALEMYEALLESDPDNALYRVNMATTQNDFGWLLSIMGRYSEAMDYQNSSLKLSALLGRPDLLLGIYLGRGTCHEEMDSFNQAYEDYRDSIEQIELIRNQFSLEEYKVDIISNKTVAYSVMISLLGAKQKNVNMAWNYVGKAKSRTLLDSLRFVDFQAPDTMPDPLKEKERRLIDSIRESDRQARTSATANKATKLSQEITELQGDLNQMYDQLVSIAPDYVDLRKGQPLSIDGIIALLKNQSRKTAFVEYYTTSEKVFIFVIKYEDSIPKLKIKELPSQQLKNYVSKYLREIVKFRDMPEIEETWHEIAEYLMAPIGDLIDGCELLYLIPHGLLHYLPLHALDINGKRLIEHFPTVYVSNLTQLKYAQAKINEAPGTCLAMGYTPNENEKKLFEGEAKMVAELFNTKPILGPKATKKLFAEKAAGKDVVHLSCHGYFNSVEPLKSGILLSDGMLTVKDIFNMNIKTNLLVLSACETGINEQKPGDELIGLTRAFLYSGVKSIMVSLWSVSAVSTLKFMESFYTKLIKKMSKAEALQQAQIEMIQDKRYFHPYFWGPFILIGDWK